MVEKSAGEERRADRHWSLLNTVVGGLIGVAGTIVAALIAHQAGAITISLSPAKPAPAVTVTVGAARTPAATSAGLGTIACPSNNNCKIFDLTAAYAGDASGRAGITIVGGNVDLIGNGDDLLYQPSSDGSPEIVGNEAQAYSIGVTAKNASEQQCVDATTHDPDPEPITQFFKGMLFCVAAPGGRGVALMEETQPLDNSNTLHLREIFWPSQ